MRPTYPVSVKGVVARDGRILLLHNERGEWELPGGRPETGEDAAAALIREFAEELSIEIAVGPILDCWNYEVLPGRYVTIVTYAVARVERGEMQVSDEHRRLGWFALGELGGLPLPEGYRRSIRAAAAEPGWLSVARELQAMAQTGLHYTKDKYDAERYERLRLLATRMLAAGSGGVPEQISTLFAEPGYTTPKIAVRAACFRDGRILMVRETTDGLWSVPGGWCDINQSAAECIKREIREESGYTARAVKLAAVWDRARHGHPPLPFTIYILYFICELTGGSPKPSIETSEIGFFAEDELPPLSLSRIQPHQIKRMFTHQRQPGLPTDFD